MRQSQYAISWTGLKIALGALALVLISRFIHGRYGSAMGILGLVLFAFAAAQTAISVWNWQRQRMKDRQGHIRSTWRI